MAALPKAALSCKMPYVSCPAMHPGAATQPGALLPFPARTPSRPAMPSSTDATVGMGVSMPDVGSEVKRKRGLSAGSQSVRRRCGKETAPAPVCEQRISGLSSQFLVHLCVPEMLRRHRRNTGEPSHLQVMPQRHEEEDGPDGQHSPLTAPKGNIHVAHQPLVEAGVPPAPEPLDNVGQPEERLACQGEK